MASAGGAVPTEPSSAHSELLAETVAWNLTNIRRRVSAAGGDCERIRIVAVTKGFGVDAWRAAAQAGLADVGENYAQELVTKALRGAGPTTADRPLRVHFLGAVQRRKVRQIAPLVDCWQGVSRTVEGEEIARRRPGATVLVEVNTEEQSGRGGCAPGEVAGLVRDLEGMDLQVRGLMTVAGREPAVARRAFRQVRELADRLGLPERSMGMSQDFALAVAEGATMIRIGEALFGNRSARPGSVNSG